MLAGVHLPFVGASSTQVMESITSKRKNMMVYDVMMISMLK